MKYIPLIPADVKKRKYFSENGCRPQKRFYVATRNFCTEYTSRMGLLG